MTPDEKYMKEALRQARKAALLNEVPIGCVIVYEDQIIARGYNRRNTDHNTISHAEINAIRKASKSVTLTEGSNTIEVTATDASGKTSNVSRTVTLDSSVPKVVSASITPNPVDAGATMLISVEITG